MRQKIVEYSGLTIDVLKDYLKAHASLFLTGSDLFGAIFVTGDRRSLSNIQIPVINRRSLESVRIRPDLHS